MPMQPFLTVPKGTQPAQCPRQCGTEIYWVERPSTLASWRKVRVTVDCSVKGGSEPDSLSPGKGIEHFPVCPNRDPDPF